MPKSIETFGTAINCIDGRVQLPVNQAVRSLFNVTYVDTVTEAGVVRFLADCSDTPETEAILASVRVSVEQHGSRKIAIAAHYDCAGNPVPEAQQRKQLHCAVTFLKSRFPDCQVVGLWIDADWKAEACVRDGHEKKDVRCPKTGFLPSCRTGSSSFTRR